MSDFGQGFLLGGFIGILCGVAAVMLMIVPIIRAGMREKEERKRINNSISRIKHAVPLSLVALLIIGCGSTAVTKIEVRERIDSVYVKGDTIRVVDVQSDTLVVVRDSSLAPGAFRSVRAALDTTVSGVRLYLQYAYPPDRWAANIIQRDTVIRWTVRDSLIERPYEVSRVPVWVYLALAGMAVALIAVIVKR